MLEYYKRGYAKGLEDAYKEVLKLVSKGHTPREIKLMLGGRVPNIDQIVAAQRFSMEDVRIEEAQPEAPSAPEVPSLGIGTYIFQEDRPDRALLAFKEMLDQGRSGLCIVRSHPNKVRQNFGLDGVRLIWLTKSEASAPMPAMATLGMGDEEKAEIPDERASPTDLSGLTSRIKTFLKGSESSVVLFEGLEYLITQNDFSRVLKFIQFINDSVAETGTTLMIPFNRSTLDEKQYNLLKQEVDQVY